MVTIQRDHLVLVQSRLNLLSLAPNRLHSSQPIAQHSPDQTKEKTSMQKATSHIAPNFPAFAEWKKNAIGRGERNQSALTFGLC